MGLVTDVDDENAPIVLLVDNNPMSKRRIEQSLRTKEFIFISCEDGDKAVDLFITEVPELVVISLDIPGLDGHIAALEMRESRNQTRIIFTSPRNKMNISRDAAFSAGAVALLEKPVSKSSFDEMWDTIMGDIPEAPGLDDLDVLYPGLVSKTKDLINKKKLIILV